MNINCVRVKQTILHRCNTSPSDSPEPADDSDPPPRLSAEGDVGVFVAQKSTVDFTNHDKYQLVVNHFTPDPAYNFPKGTGSRSFQHRWLIKYPWLSYSEHHNGGYCLPCVLFSRNANFRSDPGVLVKSPLTNFQKALELLDKHTNMMYHKRAVVDYEAFMKVMTQKQPSIQQQLPGDHSE